MTNFTKTRKEKEIKTLKPPETPPGVPMDLTDISFPLY